MIVFIHCSLSNIVIHGVVDIIYPENAIATCVQWTYLKKENHSSVARSWYSFSEEWNLKQDIDMSSKIFIFLFTIEQEKFLLDYFRTTKQLVRSKGEWPSNLNWWNNLTWTNETVTVRSSLRLQKKLLYGNNGIITWPFLSQL